jgi:hypothetical protein
VQVSNGPCNLFTANPQGKPSPRSLSLENPPPRKPSPRSRPLRRISSLCSDRACATTLFQRERGSPFHPPGDVAPRDPERRYSHGCLDGPPRSPLLASRGVRSRSHRARSLRQFQRGSLLGSCARVACSEREQTTPAGRSHWPLHRVTRFARAPSSTSLCSVERRA